MRDSFPGETLITLGSRGLAKYSLELAVVAAAYFILAKLGPALAAIFRYRSDWAPAGSPWRRSLRGLRVGPAFVAAFAAGACRIPDASLTGLIATLSAVARR